MSSSSSHAEPLVSVVIPTFNRRELVCRAIDTALAQTHATVEIIVIDDGSTDGTGESLRERYGDRIRYFAQPNGGVSRARNHGMHLARGEFIALLDSDDQWLGDKLAKQVAFLQAHPGCSMVLTDVQRIDRQHRPIDVFRRRGVIRQDGDVLLQVLQNPSLVPSSALFRTSVFHQGVTFDESLRTAEDVEFHLQVAVRFGIGVIEEPLTVALRGHEALSDDPCSTVDYIRVMERFTGAHADRIGPSQRRRALFRTHERNCHSEFVSGQLLRGSRFWIGATTQVGSPGDVVALARLATTFCRVLAVKLLRKLGLQRS